MSDEGAGGNRESGEDRVVEKAVERRVYGDGKLVAHAELRS